MRFPRMCPVTFPARMRPVSADTVTQSDTGRSENCHLHGRRVLVLQPPRRRRRRRRRRPLTPLPPPSAATLTCSTTR
eukprot:3343964-Prymnesium_polylepis.1